MAATRPVTAATRPVIAATRPVTAATRPPMSTARSMMATARPMMATTLTRAGQLRIENDGTDTAAWPGWYVKSAARHFGSQCCKFAGVACKPSGSHPASPVQINNKEEHMEIRYHSGAVCLGALLLFGGGAARAAGPTCESLAGLSLADITITTAHSVPAGSFTAADGEVFAGMPAFCRIAAFAAPTTQSHINFEVWMPQSGWNGKFRGEGSGGSAGSISFSAMASALQRGYATMANDNGHTGSVWTFSAMPEKVTDFGWRAQHVSTVAGKAITQAFYG